MAPMQIPGMADLRVAADESGLSEELNLLWAGHEIVGGMDVTGRMLDWMEARFAERVK